jgi:hypothetical protein
MKMQTQSEMNDDKNGNASAVDRRYSVQGFAAIFIDYENVYYHLRSTYADVPELNDFVIELLMNLQMHLEETSGLRSIIAKAYADYERIKSTPQGSLYLMGVETVYVLGTDHKNAADMKLSIDAMEVLYTRPEIETFVLFAGDRDYIPVIQHLKKQAKSVIAVGFAGSFSGDLMTNVGKDNFIDAKELLAPERLAKLEEISKRYRDYEKAEEEREAERLSKLPKRKDAREIALEAQKRSFEEQSKPLATESMPEVVEGGAEPESHENVVSIEGLEPAGIPEGDHQVPKKTEPLAEPEGTFNIPMTDMSEDERTCLDLMLTHFGKYPEIFLSPFLRKLSDTLPNLADWQRKGLIGDLEFKGAIRMAKRSAIPFDYTVMLVNYNHPVVREMC